MFPNCRMSCLGCYREAWEGVSLVRGRRASTTELGAGDWTRPSSTILPWTSVSHWSWAIKKSVPWSSDLISSVILPYRSFISSLPTGGSTVCPSPSHLSKGKADIDLFIQAQLGRPLNPLPHPPCTHIWVWINLSLLHAHQQALYPPSLGFPGPLSIASFPIELALIFFFFGGKSVCFISGAKCPNCFLHLG